MGQAGVALRVERVEKGLAESGTNMLSHVLSQSGGADDVNQLLDDLKSRMGFEFTIFEGNTRAYTTVTQNGRRAVGTTLSPELSESVLQKGQSYVGKATILEEEYLCSYVPTRDAAGAVSGLLFVGISSAEANHQIFMTVIWSSLVSLAVIVAGIFFLTAYLKKMVSGPLAEITRAASRLEQGSLVEGGDQGITVRSNDEVGQLARIFEGDGPASPLLHRRNLLHIGRHRLRRSDRLRTTGIRGGFYIHQDLPGQHSIQAQRDHEPDPGER